MTLSIDLTPAQIRKEGWEARTSKLGVAKTLDFCLIMKKTKATTRSYAKNSTQDKRSSRYFRIRPMREPVESQTTIQDKRKVTQRRR
jgi:hypothetical protein